MRIGSWGLVAFLVTAFAWPGRARACDPALPALHTIDPAQVGLDQTPPQLPQPTVAQLRNIDNGEGGCANKCGSDHSVRLINLGTDDMTPPDRIGYRVTLVSGTASNLTTSSGNAILGAADGSLTLFWDGDDDFDFTLRLVAVDAAGNVSAPQTVRISGGGGCNIAGRRVSDGFALALFALVLAAATTRRRATGRARQGHERR